MASIEKTTQSSQKTVTKVNMKYMHYFITAAIIFGSPYIPPIEPITPLGMAVLGTFIGTIYGWTFLDMVWPSILGIMGLGLACGMGQVLAAGFGNPIIVMLFLMFAILALLSETKTTEVIAKGFITNKLTLGRPWLFIYVFLIGVAICTQINVFVSMIVFSAILFDLCNKLGIKPYTKFPLAILTGIVIAIQLGQITIPFKSSALTLVAAYSAMTGGAPNFVQYMCFTIPMLLIMLGAYVLFCRFIIRLDVSALKNATQETFGERQSLNRDQKIATGCLVSVILILLLPNILPKTLFLTVFLSKLTMFGQAAIVILVMMLLKKEDGKPFFNYNMLASKGVSWEAIFMTCFIMPVSQFLTADGTGIKEFLTQILTPMTLLQPMIFIIAIMVFATILTNFANNVVLAIIILPVVVSFSGQMGLSSLGMACILFMVTQLAIFTPGASVFAGIAFSYSDWIQAPMMMKHGVITILFMMIVSLAIGIPLSFLIF